MNTMSEKMMITLCLVPHIVPSPLHSTYPEVCNVTTEYLLPGLGWAGLWCKLYNFPDLIQAQDYTERAAVTAFETY